MKVMRVTGLGLVSLLTVGITSVTAQPYRGEPSVKGATGTSDNLMHPQAARQYRLRQEALKQQVQAGRWGAGVQKVGDRYVELSQTRKDRIFVIVAEFGDTVHPSYPGVATGPVHNSIAKPGPNDNTTIWQADFSRDHYRDMYFNRMLDYYQMQSSGRYGFDGDVTEWVRVPYNEARYGRNSCGSNVCSNVWNLISDAVGIWYADQIAQGKTPRRDP